MLRKIVKWIDKYGGISGLVALSMSLYDLLALLVGWAFIPWVVWGFVMIPVVVWEETKKKMNV